MGVALFIVSDHVYRIKIFLDPLLLLVLGFMIIVEIIIDTD